MLRSDFFFCFFFCFEKRLYAFFISTALNYTTAHPAQTSHQTYPAGMPRKLTTSFFKLTYENKIKV